MIIFCLTEDAGRMILDEIAHVEYSMLLTDDEDRRRDLAIEMQEEDDIVDEVWTFFDPNLKGKAYVPIVDYTRANGKMGRIFSCYDIFICNNSGKTIHRLQPELVD